MARVKMYPAKNGDATLVQGGREVPTTILIDGGYAGTFSDYILPDFRDLASRGLGLDLVIATHIDADHVSGLLALFKENGSSGNPRILPIREVFHNSLRSFGPTTESGGRMEPGEEALVNEITKLGYPRPGSNTGAPNEISAQAGSSLASLLLGGGYCWNRNNGFQAVSDSTFSNHAVTPSARLVVIGPPVARLEALRGWWIGEMRRLGFTGKIGGVGHFDDAFEFLCASENRSGSVEPHTIAHKRSDGRRLDEIYFPDDSITNGSSISLIIEVDSKRLLFLGDSWAEDMEKAIRTLPCTAYPMMFDAIKVSHHGSSRNTSPALLELIDSPVYLVLSNGHRHNHPDSEVLKAIVDRPTPFGRQLYFNYRTAASREMLGYVSKSRSPFSVHESYLDWIEL
jgi:hypothetical protein